MSRVRCTHRCALATALSLAATPPALAEDDGGVNMGMTGMMARQLQAAELAAKLEGTWMITVDPVDVPGGCDAVSTPEPRLWTVTSSEADLTVKQAGDTQFPSLTGYVISDSARGSQVGKTEGWSVVVWGAQAADAAPRASIWLDLRLGVDGKLGGTWRYLGWREMALPGGGRGTVPCFADFRVAGKR